MKKRIIKLKGPGTISVEWKGKGCGGDFDVSEQMKPGVDYVIYTEEYE